MSSYDTDDFETDVIERSREIPVLVDFWAEWCGPCRRLTPVLEQLAEEGADGEDRAWELVKVNTEKHPRPAARYGVRSIPNVKLFVDGEIVDEFSGALPERAVRRWLERTLPSPSREEIGKARELLAEEEDEEAARRLRRVLRGEPENEEARILLARTIVFREPGEAVDLVDEVGVTSEHADEVESIRVLARLFERLDRPESLPDGTTRETYLDAIEALRARRFDDALDGFIRVIEARREYDDDGARKACLAIFHLLGEDHPITREHRRSFANVVLA